MNEASSIDIRCMNLLVHHVCDEIYNLIICIQIKLLSTRQLKKFVDFILRDFETFVRMTSDAVSVVTKWIQAKSLVKHIDSDSDLFDVYLIL